MCFRLEIAVLLFRQVSAISNPQAFLSIVNIRFPQILCDVSLPFPIRRFLCRQSSHMAMLTKSMVRLTFTLSRNCSIIPCLSTS